MLTQRLLQPDVLRALGRAGHGSQVLIADGNYPLATTLAANATLVSLNLSPGVVTATQVLLALVSAIPIESAAVMSAPRDGEYSVPQDPPIWDEFREVLATVGFDDPLGQVERVAFYEAGVAPTVALGIATGEQQIYANLLLTIGVVRSTEATE